MSVRSWRNFYDCNRTQGSLYLSTLITPLSRLSLKLSLTMQCLSLSTSSVLYPFVILRWKCNLTRLIRSYQIQLQVEVVHFICSARVLSTSKWNMKSMTRWYLQLLFLKESLSNYIIFQRFIYSVKKCSETFLLASENCWFDSFIDGVISFFSKKIKMMLKLDCFVLFCWSLIASHSSFP